MKAMGADHYLGVGRQTGSAFMESFEVLATITLYWEVQMVLHLLGWKVDLIRFPTMYDMNPEMSQVGIEFHVKLRYLSVNSVLCV